MIYLDHGATSFPKPEPVRQAVAEAMAECANPGRGSHAPSERAAERLFSCRTAAGALFHCKPEQVVFTANCTHGLNMAIRTLVGRGDRVVISGFEHNAVTRVLYDLGARVIVAGRRLFDREDTLRSFCRALDTGVRAAVFTHTSNVFGYRLPVEQMALACRKRNVPFIIDGAQAAGAVPIDLERLGAAFIAMPGHKGLLGPMGTGILLCRRLPKPLICGGTGSESQRQEMPDFLPDRGEAGTANVPGIAGLEAGIRLILERGPEKIGQREAELIRFAAAELRKLGMDVFAGAHQGGTLSFRSGLDCMAAAERLGEMGIAVRGGLHCAPLAHRSGGTFRTGTVRVSVGPDTKKSDVEALLYAVQTTFVPWKN